MACLERLFVADQIRERDFSFKQPIGNHWALLFIYDNIEQHGIEIALRKFLTGVPESTCSSRYGVTELANRPSQPFHVL